MDKKNKGITLIALVITIIVLIILAGVAINMVVGQDGLIKQAEKAKTDTLNAQVESDEKLNALEEKINKVTEENKTNLDLSKFKAGDYVKYDTGDTSVGKNGVIICRVLYEASSEYGLQIISDKNIKDVTIAGSNWGAGTVCYNNAVETLNNEAEKYLNTEYAIDARCVGNVPTNQEGIFTNKNTDTTQTVILSFTPSGWSTRDSGCKEADTNYETDINMMEAIEIRNTGEYYWLTSRHKIIDSSHFEFHVRYIGNSGNLESGHVCHINSDGTKYGSTVGGRHTNGLRACFSLKSDIKITEGNGASEETAYVLGI